MTRSAEVKTLISAGDALGRTPLRHTLVQWLIKSITSGETYGLYSASMSMCRLGHPVVRLSTTSSVKIELSEQIRADGVPAHDSDLAVLKQCGPGEEEVRRRSASTQYSL